VAGGQAKVVSQTSFRAWRRPADCREDPRSHGCGITGGRGCGLKRHELWLLACPGLMAIGFRRQLEGIRSIVFHFQSDPRPWRTGGGGHRFSGRRAGIDPGAPEGRPGASGWEWVMRTEKGALGLGHERVWGEEYVGAGGVAYWVASEFMWPEAVCVVAGVRWSPQGLLAAGPGVFRGCCAGEAGGVGRRVAGALASSEAQADPTLVAGGRGWPLQRAR